MKNLGMALFAALVVTIGLWGFLVRGGQQGAAASAGQSTPPAAFERAPAPGLGSSAWAGREDVAGVAVPAAAEPVAAIDPGGSLLQGTVVVLDPEGTEHRRESGSMWLRLQVEDGMTSRKLEVVDGRWQTTVPEDVRLFFGNMSFDGRRVVSEMGGDIIPPPTDELLEVRARWPAPTVIHVRAEDTGLHLDDVELRTSSGVVPHALSHPGGSDAVMGALVPSPIELERPDRWYQDRGIVFARAPGYAWGTVEVDFSLGGDRFLDLERGGGLDVDIAGDVDGAMLRLEDRDAPYPVRMYERELNGEPRVEISALPPAVYLVSVELGSAWNDPVPLGEATVEVFAGQRSRAVLNLDEAPQVPLVPLRGVVVVPSAWNNKPTSLQVKLLDAPLAGQATYTSCTLDPEPVEGTETWAWDAGEVQAGRYELSTFDPSFSVSLEIGPEGETHAVLEIPPPGRVVVRAVDEATGLDSSLEGIYWHARRPQWVLGGRIESARRNPETGLFEFMAPRCEIVVESAGIEWDDSGASFEVGAGVTEQTLLVQRACGFRLTVRDGENVLPYDADWDVSAREVGGEGRSCGSAPRPRERLVRVSHPGSYGFEFPDVQGYFPVPEQTVVVEPGAFAEHVVHLVRVP